MTSDQEKIERRVRDEIDTIRGMLDYLMYGTNVSDEEYRRLRAAYDKICEANDAL